MAQLSGFTKAFNMSMNNMLTFAQMKQGQEHRKAQLKQQEYQNKINQASLLAPFLTKDNAPSVRRNALSQYQKMFPNSPIDFSKLSVDTPEFNEAANNIKKLAQSMRDGKTTPEQFLEQGQKWIEHADWGTKRKAEEKAGLEKIVERHDKTTEAAKAEKIRMEKDITAQKDKIAEGLKWEAEQAVRERRVTATERKEGAEKAGKNYMLSNREMVTSFDGGRTYRNKAGKDVKMPHDAIGVNATLTGPDLAMFDAQAQVPKDGKPTQAIGSKGVAEGGTGPYAMLASAVDKLFGGLGADKLFGKKGFFPETQENRQVLRTIKQLGKSALMNSSRGAIWEQKRIDELFPDPDKLFTNPRTEGKKFITLRKTLQQEKEFNNSAILSSVTPKEVSELRKANVEIDRLLSMIGPGQKAGLLSAEDKALINKYAPKQ